jgi:acetyl-CoA carboxylase biotin carboxyl carrier protein
MQDKKANALDIPQIKKLIALVEDSNLSEFEVEQDSFRLKLRKGAGSTVEIAAAPAPAIQAAAPAAVAPAAPQDDENFHYINAPMVGTFYRSPSPEAEFFVEVGSKVSKNTVVCIVEAMKVMNELPADCSGTVAEILVENGNGVEYGQPLFKIAKN